VIHIGTVHYREERWIDIQLRYLARYTREPYRVYASLDGVDARHEAKFDHAFDHAFDGAPVTVPERGLVIDQKLNLLAQEMTSRAGDDDLIVFMHGDTLPITDWVAPVRRMREGSRLAAVRRDENMEPIPHWCFTVTTAGYWTEIGGDWGRGPTWKALGEDVTDTGAALWDILERRGESWHPILRTNAVNLHPLWFAVYGGLVYHHGAGFRPPMSRLDASFYAHLPIGLRNFAGVRRRLGNTLNARRIERRLRKDERFFEKFTMASRG